MSSLTGKQKRYLRGLGHGLEPVLQVGKGGVTPPVVAATDEALLTHELIKVRRGSECPADRHEVGAALASGTGAEVVQTLGRTLLLYRAHPDTPRIQVPG